MKVKEEYIIVSVYLIISLISIWGLLTEYGPIGYRHDWSIPQYDFLLQNDAKSLLNIWNEKDLGMKHDYLSVFFFYELIGIMGFLGIGGVVITKSLIFFFIFFSGYLMYLLAQFFTKKKYAFYSGLFYMLTPVMFNKIVAGHVTYLFSYALAPLAFLLFLKSLKNYKNTLLAGIVFALTLTQLQFFIMFPLIIILWTLWKREYIASCLTIFLIGFLIHSFWIMPIIYDMQNASETINSAVTPNLIIRRSPPLIAVPFLIGFTYFVNAIFKLGIIPWAIGGAGVLLLISLNFLSKSKTVWFFIILAGIGLFLAKGSTPPFGEWYLSNPLTGIFREINHLMFIPAFAYALLFGFAIQKLKGIKYYIPLITVILYALPFFTGNFAGEVQVYSLPDEYGKLTQSLSNERILWIPMDQPIKTDNALYAGIDPLIAYTNSLNQVISGESDSNRVTAVLSNIISLEENPDQLLDLLGIQYIIIRDDFVSMFWNYSYMNQYSELSSRFNKSKDYIKGIYPEDTSFWIIGRQSPVHKLVNNNPLPLVYAADKSILYSGDLNILNDYKLLNTTKPALFIASQSSTELINLTDEVIINNNDLDLMNYSYKFTPSSYTQTSNASEGYSGLYNYNFGWWWYNPEYTLLTESSALSLKPNTTLEIPYSVKEGNYYVLIKASGNYESNINENKTILNLDKPEWINLGNYNLKQGKITITNLNESLIAEVRLLKNLTDTVSKADNFYLKLKECNVKPAIVNKSFQFSGATFGIYGCVNDCNPRFDEYDNKALFLTHFYQNASVNEYILIRIPVNVTINQTPILSLEASVSDPEITHLELGIRTGEIFSLINSYILDTEFKKITINLSTTNFSNIEFLEVYLHKRYGVSAEDKKYGFALRNYGFYSNEYLLNHYCNELNMNPGNYTIDFGKAGLHNTSLGIFNKTGEVFINSSNINITTYNDLRGVNVKRITNKSVNNHNATLSFKRISPSLIEVEVNNTEPFFLVFSESYYNEWNAQINNTIFPHYEVNGFANAFYINNTGNFKIKIYYKEQEFYQTGLIFSIILILTLLIIVFKEKIIILTLDIKNIMFSNSVDYEKKMSSYLRKSKTLEILTSIFPKITDKLLILSFIIIILSGIITRLNRLIGALIGIIGYCILAIFVIIKILKRDES